MDELSLFTAAVALKVPAERAALLDQHCKGNPPLRERLEKLLAENDRSQAALDSPAFAQTTGHEPRHATADFPGKDAHVDTIIAGKYRLKERIGEGGMGSVWLVDQSEPIKRRVALKLIKAGMDSKQVLTRFEAERQALALMDHPNIAKVLDGGLHEGRPFFVMELVKGSPITSFCDTRKLTPRERLELFVPICQAIQHAHQKGIIHRDIKPSNVLIALYDDKPVVKVIDFGVAKATGGTLTEATIDTGFGGVVGTPQYMSPEQATFNNLDIDTRSDVYALGVLLYELLTGSTPFTKKELAEKGLIEILRVVREEEPPRPSTKLSTADALPSIAATRSTEPTKLTGLLRNELDWIVMKALEKDRSRRYETANGFAADIQRYLCGEAVLAHPPSTAYRIKKIIRRNKGKVIAAGLVLAALLAGIIGTSLGLLEAQKQEQAALSSAERERKAKELAETKRQEAEQQQKRAEAGEKLAGERLVQVEAEKKKVETEKKRADEETRIAQAVKDFLQTKLLAQADTTTQANQLLRRGGLAAQAKYNPTIKELLDRAAVELAVDKIESNFPGQPLVQAELLKTVGVAYLGIGEAATALPFLTRSVDLFRNKLGPESHDTLGSMATLAGGYAIARKLDQALPLLEESLRLMKAKFGPEHPDTVTCMNNLAGCYHEAGKLDQALPLYEEAVRLMKARIDPDDRPDKLLLGMNNLAGCYEQSGKLDKALPMYEETLRLMKTKLGPDHPATLNCMNNLAGVYQETGRLDKALPMYEETFKLSKEKLGPEHPETLTCMGNLAGCYEQVGKPDLALPLHEETLRLTKAKLGAEHPHTLRSMNNLANCYANAGKPDLALPLHEETFKFFKANLPPGHANIIISMNNLAMCYRDAGKLDKALPLLEETFKLMKTKFGPNHLDTLICMGNLAGSYRDAGKLDKALPLFEETLKLSKANLGLDHPDTLRCMHLLAGVYQRVAKLDQALPMYEETLRLRKAKLGPDHPDTLLTMNNLGNLYRDAKQGAKASAILAEFINGQRKKFPKDDPRFAGLAIQVALDLLKVEQFALAESMLRECLTIREKSEPDAWSTFNTHSLLGAALLGQKKYADAEPLLVKGYEGMKAREKSIPPQGSTRIPEALDRLIQLYMVTNKPDEVKKYQELRAKYPKAEAKK